AQSLELLLELLDGLDCGGLRRGLVEATIVAGREETSLCLTTPDEPVELTAVRGRGRGAEDGCSVVDAAVRQSHCPAPSQGADAAVEGYGAGRIVVMLLGRLDLLGHGRTILLIDDLGQK